MPIGLAEMYALVLFIAFVIGLILGVGLGHSIALEDMDRREARQQIKQSRHMKGVQ